MQEERDPDVGWVAALSGADTDSAAAAVAEAARQRWLFDAISRRHRRVGRRSYVEIDAPLELYALARLLRPRHVVEVGVSSGVSSAYLLAALEMNGLGTLHSVDLPLHPRAARAGRPPPQFSWSLPPGKTSGWAIPSRLRHRWDLRLGDKAAVLPRLAAELPAIDLFLYDVPHDDRGSRKEFESLDPRLSPGSVAIVDHGPGGGRCRALAAWGRAHHAASVGRSGLGLHGIRLPLPDTSPGAADAAPWTITSRSTAPRSGTGLEAAPIERYLTP